MIDWSTILAGVTKGKTVLELADNDIVFLQGEPADSVYFLLSGKVRLGVASQAR